MYPWLIENQPIVFTDLITDKNKRKQKTFFFLQDENFLLGIEQLFDPFPHNDTF